MNTAPQVAPPLTEEQERALAAAAAAGAAGIAAGAGAGKTTLLAEAFWRDIEDENVPLESMLVATYNRAAAAHLRTRLLARFAVGRGPARVGLDLSDAWVGTFHAIAARIVRENPFAAGVDPEFGELDDTEAASLMEQALDQALDAVTHPGLVELLQNLKNTDLAREAVRHCHDRLRAAGHEEPRITGPRAGAATDEQLTRLRGLIAAVRAHPKVNEKSVAQADLAEAMLDGEEPPPAVPRVELRSPAFKEEVGWDFNAAAEVVWTGLVNELVAPQLDGFAALLAETADRYAALKRERGALDYEDLLLAARRVLAGGHDYAFRRVYVDEYQDANALQEEIIGLLGVERTIVVGDGCQAIYGFRHADPDHFRKRVGDPPRIRLADNHRSQPRVLEWLNELLADVLVSERAFAPLAPAAPPSDEPVPLAEQPVELIDVVSTDDDRATRAQEAVAVAARVSELLNDGYGHRDIVVLFRAMTEVEPYRAALELAGIPAHLVAGRGFFTHEQVADTTALLRLVENPHEEPALIRVLASPYVGASNAELIALRERAGREQPLWPAVGGSPATAVAAALVDELRPLLRERGLAGLVEAAVAANGYDLAVLGMPDGARRHANLRKLVRMAAAHGSVRGPNLRGFLGLLEMMADADNQDPGEATLVDPDMDAVRLATIHSVKGQEFPVVILADASHRIPTTAPTVMVDREGRAGLRLPRAGEDRVSVLGWAELARGQRDADRAEERRVAYVALTRAERHIAVIGRSGARSGPDTHFEVLSVARGPEGAPRRVVVPAPEGGDRRTPMLVPDATPAPAPEVVPPPLADGVRGRRLSFTALDALATCARRFHLEYERGLHGDPDRVIGDGRGAASAWGATALGDLVHRRLAEHDWRGPAPAAGWAPADAEAAGLPPSPVDAARAERMVADLVASPLAWRIRDAEAIWPERAFALTVDGAVLTGAIDLLADLGDGTALVCDWKTHALAGRAAAHVAAEYALQQDLYALAALRAGFRRAELIWAVLEDLGGSPARVIAAGGPDAAAAERAVHEALAPLRVATRPAAARTPQPFCSGCPGLTALCPVARA